MCRPFYAAMSANNLHNALLRPPIIQILRAAGFHSTRPSVLDTLTDLTARYLLLLGSSTAEHANNSHPGDPIPTIEDVRLALQDAGAIPRTSSRIPSEEDLLQWQKNGEEGRDEFYGLESFLSWFEGPVNREIRRIAGFVPSEGEVVVDAEAAELQEDYLSALKKKHSKTGEESRYAGTVLGKSADDHPIVIEGGDATSILDWGLQISKKAREARQAREVSAAAESESSEMSSVMSSLSDAEGMDL